MDWRIKGGEPVYRQIIRQLRNKILAGAYPPGSSVPPVRTLAAELGVNPHAAEHALWTMEQEGMIVSGDCGPCFTADPEMLSRMSRETVLETTRACAREFAKLGLTPSQGAMLLMQLENEEE